MARLIKKQPKRTKKTKKTPNVRKGVKKTVSMVHRVSSSEVAKEPSGSEKGPKVPVVHVDGKVVGRTTLPTKLFAAKINAPLLAQAVRVRLANQRMGNASTKTRGEVEGSTRKIYRQKGTGRARHGAIRAPIFVGGGVVFGPKPRDYSLKLSKGMRRSALASALTSKLAEGGITIVSGLAVLPPKTRVFAKMLSLLGVPRPVLLITSPVVDTMVRACRNIPQVDLLPIQQLAAYDVLSHRSIVFMKEAVDESRRLLLKKTSHHEGGTPNAHV